MKAEDAIPKLLKEMERRFSSPWGFYDSDIVEGVLKTGPFVKRGDGIMIDPERWQRFKQKWLAKAEKLPA